MNITSRSGASNYQTTNYGLAGLVETHFDAWGYESGVELVFGRRKLVNTGDYIATFMGWLGKVPLGGGTGFDFPDYEGLSSQERDRLLSRWI